MRILFSATPLLGHLLPLLPLAEAARRAGHDVAVLTGESMAGAVGDLPLLPAGPEMGAVWAESSRRTGEAGPIKAGAAPSTAAELLGGARVDLTVGEAIPAAEGFAPDLLVCAALDLVGPMAAAALGVPWAVHGITIAVPDAFVEAMEAKAALRYAERGLTPTARAALVDPWPGAMQPEGWVAPQDRIAVRPKAYAPVGGPDAAAWSAPTFPGREDRPLVLVTLGTVFDDRAALDAILDSLVPTDTNVLLTLGPGGDPDSFDVDRGRVRPVGFVPLDRLLEGVDLVVAAGAGTVLGTLSKGLPMVLMPMLAEQPLIAARLSALGLAAVASAPEEVGEAVGGVLADPSYRTAAGTIAGKMEGMNPPEEALRLLLDRIAPGLPRRNP